MKRIFFLLFFLFLGLWVQAQPQMQAQTQSATGTVHILAVNDMHAAIERFPQFAAVVDSLRTIYPDLLLLSAGDNRTGNPINDVHAVPSKPMVDLMNAVGFNYSALGNHEFDGGIDGLRSVINNSNCRYLCANMVAPDSLRLHTDPFALVERNGISIGLLGLVQRNPYTGLPDAHPKLFGPLQFRPVDQVALTYAWMRNVCDVFILLTHNGFEDDIKLASVMPEVDVIVGGHTHTKVDPCWMEGNVMITQAERFLKYATLVTISVQDGKVVDKQATLIDIMNYPTRVASVQAMVDSFSNDQTLKRVLTQATNPFACKEELGCLMADAMRQEAQADIAVQNSGGVRYDTKEAGAFTVNDVYRLDPFGNEMVVFNLTGEEMERMLAAICRADDYGPAFVSGIAYTIHLGEDNRDVKQVSITLPDGSRFDRKRTYRVVMSSYVATVSDYEKEDEGANLFLVVSDGIIHYLSRQPSVDYLGVSRVTIKNGL